MDKKTILQTDFKDRQELNSHPVFLQIVQSLTTFATNTPLRSTVEYHHSVPRVRAPYDSKEWWEARLEDGFDSGWDQRSKQWGGRYNPDTVATIRTNLFKCWTETDATQYWEEFPIYLAFNFKKDRTILTNQSSTIAHWTAGMTVAAQEIAVGSLFKEVNDLMTTPGRGPYLKNMTEFVPDLNVAVFKDRNRSLEQVTGNNFPSVGMLEQVLGSTSRARSQTLEHY